MTEQLAWLIPVLPLIGFLINGLGYKKNPKGLVGLVGCASVLGSFILSILVFFDIKANGAKTIDLYEWISVGTLKIPFSFLIDQLTSIMLLIITGVGFLIHVYSTGYMHDDEGYGKYFAYLNLFVFFMLLLVLGSNYVIMFIGWEGVGLCSYLLIGFWFKKTEYANAAKKAFVMNRIGDLGFLIGIFMLFSTFGSISYADIFPQAQAIGTPVLTAITLLLFVGAMGKSAQLPLYTWLPDAMAGPTPVSALIHAATMVTAGIYMIARSNVLYVLSPISMAVVAGIGLATAIFAAVIALTQNDIKKVLAYSTVSQLGYMFLGLGVGAFTGAFFHVMTHAFFKALLFLGAGSVIHAMGGEQDMRQMGGLKKHLPITWFTMLMGTLAIAGIPPFSGFFSKDEILAHAFEVSPTIWVIGVLGALLTAFYMFRMFFLTFNGKFRGTEAQHHHLHESPVSMTFPLIVLAILSVVGGFVGVPEAIAHLFGGHGESHLLNEFLSPVFSQSTTILNAAHHGHLSHETEYALMGASVLGVLISIFYAYTVYVRKETVPAAETARRVGLEKASYNKFYIDEIYNAVFTRPLDNLSQLFYRILDKSIIDGIVNGFGQLTQWSADKFRRIQNGYIGSYMFMMVVGIILILVFNFLF
ncbi:NADH-quinone oxidoreductase subunit L [Solitalea sp. MAHUQ-68]|uniref:NADH-quinone oxidoreductase subunit L n=1 Tax=Solitalea agri TaxID=2953739 RepID=A0A9X2JC14_9SPHI|nr:NADH-quinone oxidoreductase subunit L [Solitalea agri]MCO4291280.1 NADH-quinone oxidoreductase subunit L [Solitalea agri]